MKNPNTMILQFAILLLLSNLWAAVSSESTERFIQCLFRNSDDPAAISQVIYTPQNATYQPILDFYIQNLRFTTAETSKPKLIIAPVRESQIQTAIYCGREHGLQMKIRSGGHDFEGTSYVSPVPFFILDMFNFRSISIDLETQTAWVGAGATLGETYHSISQKKKSLAFPGGVWPTVGIGGHISAGGYGPLVRKHGLAADNVIDARVIDANGKILNSVAKEDEDLFWAIRGGYGGSFAVILEYKLKLAEVPERIAVFKVTRNLEQGATKLVLKWQRIAHKLPVELLLSVNLQRVNSNQSPRGSTIEAKFISLYHGSVNTLLSLMELYFPELGLLKEDCIEIDWIQYYAFLLGHPIENIDQFLTRRDPPLRPYFKAKADLFQNPIPEEGLEKIWDLFFEVDPRVGQMDWNAFGGIMDRIPESSIPYPHRAGNSFIAFEVVFWEGTEPELIKQRVDWIEKFHKLLGNYVANKPRRAYAAYRDLDLGTNKETGETSVEEARVWAAPYFMGNYDRLVQVKTKVDPSNFFRNEQSIPPFTFLDQGSEEAKTI